MVAPLDPRITNAVLGAPPPVPFRDRIARKHIFPGESGGDYDTLFGHAQRAGGRFAGTKLTDMTVDEALDFANPSGEYGQFVAAQNGGTVATPMGAYQVVGTTLRKAKEDLGLRGDEKMTSELQDRIGEYIYETQGPAAWKGWDKGPSLGDGNGGQPESYAMLANSPYRSDASSPVLSSMNMGFLPDGALVGNTNAEPEPKTFWGKVDRFAQSGNNSDKLLAIGAGLLSGNNWREGIAAAGSGLAGVDAQARKEDLAWADLASEDAYRRGALQQRAEPRDPAFMQQAGVMVLPDGSPVETVFDPNSGAIMYHDGQGFKRVPLDATPANNSDVSGGKYTKTAEDLRARTLETGITLGAIDGTMDLLERVKEDKNYGIRGLASDVSIMGKTLFAQEPDVKELIRKGATSEIAGLIGRMREGVVGPGAPSNFDMAQVLIAVGGDLSMLSSPDAMLDQMTRIGSRLQDQYNNDYDQLEAITTQYPQLPVVKPPRTKLKDRAKRDNTGVGAGPASTGTAGTTKSGIQWSVE